MAYKTYKINKGNVYNKHNKVIGSYKEPKYEIARMKLFGFRSGIAWKMIPAMFYYIFMACFLFSSIMGEVREFQFENMDVLLTIFKYVFLIIVCFSPAIFLSDFKYREKLPLFKNRSLTGNVVGLIIVFVASWFMIWTYQYCMSDTYTASADAYYEEQESIMQEKMKAAEEATTIEPE